MQPPILPDNELQRLTALREQSLLDTSAEERFDRLTRLARQMFGIQIALVSLVDAERQWFKSRQGLDACETGRDISFCGHAILSSDIFHIADARLDPRFADNPLVTGPPHIRFYAGAPLATTDGYRIGTLCIIDDQPRQLTAPELQALRDLADCVEAEISHVSVQQQKQILNQFKSTLDRTHDCVFMFDAVTLHFFYANHSALLQVGYDMDELRGMHPYDIEASLNETSFRQLIAPLLVGEQASITFETTHKNRQGLSTSVEIILQYITAADETPRFVAIMRDISEHKHYEETLQFYETIVQSSDDAMITAFVDVNKTPGGIITSWNLAAEKMYGYTASEAIGQPILMLVPPDRKEEGAMVLQKIATGEKLRNFVTVRQRKDGSLIHISSTVSAIMDENNHVIGACNISRDLTERKQAADALREQIQHTQAILDNVIDGIITIDERGTVESFNQAAEHIFGFSPDEVLGKNINMLMPEPYHSKHDSYLDNYRATGIKQVIGIGREVTGQRKNGDTFPMDLAVSEISHNGRRMFIGLVRDITERKRVEQMKSEFVSTVSHELRTPLTSIAGALGLLMGGALGELLPQVKSLINIAHKNSQRLNHMINDLLDMEKITAGKMSFEMQVLALTPLVEQSLEANKAYGEQRRVRFELTEQVDGIKVQVDSQRLQQVLANFLSNAAKFSPEGDTVEVAISRRDGRVKIAVRDHGPGIPDEFRSRIFTKFSQADSSDTRQKGGTGLGLAITKELIERMGGTIGFDSTAGEGATFWIQLPLHEHDIGQVADTPPAADTGNLGAHRILVVEDEPDIAHLLSLMLAKGGYLAMIADSGEKALAMLAEDNFAAMTLDLMLPGITGLEVIHRVRQNPATANLPIVVVSAKVEDGKLAIDGDFANIDWLPKPLDEKRLLSAIKLAIPHGQHEHLRILHVEDDTDLHYVVRAMVGARFTFEHATNLADAHAMLTLTHYDMVILDLTLPDGSGWELLPLIREQKPATRVIILSGTELSRTEANKVEAALLKSHVSPQDLLDAINTRITKNQELPI